MTAVSGKQSRWGVNTNDTTVCSAVNAAVCVGANFRHCSGGVGAGVSRHYSFPEQQPIRTEVLLVLEKKSDFHCWRSSAV